MNLPELHRKLIAAARAIPADDRVPYAFEKRIMARLTSQKPQDAWSLWGRALSRGAALCVAIMVVFSAASYLLPVPSSQVSLSQDVEQTLLAAVDNNNADQDAQ